MGECTLKNRQKIGNWFFRNRSYLPLVLLPVVLFALWKEEINYNLTRDIFWAFVPFTVSLFGLYIRILVIGQVPGGTSSRNTLEGQVADHLNTTGLYSIVRHPLYVGNFFMWFGISLYTFNPVLIVAFIAIFWIIYENITFAEELFLEEKYGERYREWMRKTPAFLPKFSQYTRSEMEFSVRTVLKKEYSGFFATIAIFTFLVHYRAFIHHELHVSITWSVVFAVGLLMYLSLRSLKRKTRLLHVMGR